jgi:hypothetical protein
VYIHPLPFLVLLPYIPCSILQTSLSIIPFLNLRVLLYAKEIRHCGFAVHHWPGHTKDRFLERQMGESSAKRVRRINQWKKRLGFAYVFGGSSLKST